MIEFLNLATPMQAIRGEVEAALCGVLDASSYVLGNEVEQFELEFAEFVGARHCIAVGNGLDALTLALRGLGVGPGDEVIVPSHTFIATWLAVSMCGATPVAVEVDRSTRNLDPRQIEGRITAKTRAIVPVHLYGRSADMAAISRIARAHGLCVVQDAAQAHGATFKGRPVGAEGTSAWSFYPGKNLGALGDGGAVTTDDASLAAELRLLRNYGSSRRYHHEIQGVNSRLDEIQAAVLRVKLRQLSAWNSRRTEIAAHYARGLADLPLTLPIPDSQDNKSSWHLYVVEVEQRDLVQQRLAGLGVQSLIHYPIPPHRQKAYLNHRDEQHPVAEDLAASIVSLPMGPHLSLADAEVVIDAVGQALPD